jgi:hypothetical protein
MQAGPLFKAQLPETQRESRRGPAAQGWESALWRRLRDFANRGAQVECSGTSMCNRQVHSFPFIFIFLQKALLEPEIWELGGVFSALTSLTRCKREEKNHPHFPSGQGREKPREIHAACMQPEEEGSPREPCALPGDAFTVSWQSACSGVQPASPPPARPATAPLPQPPSAAAAAAGSRRGTRAEGERERERTARERREGRKRVITRGRRGSGGPRRRSAPVLRCHRHPRPAAWAIAPRRRVGKRGKRRQCTGEAVAGRRSAK